MLSSRKYRYLTISIDDGHPADLRVAELLARFGLTATFYIPAHNPEREVIMQSQVRQLAANFEIGCHTMHHVPLTSLPESEARSEIHDGKQWTEDTISGPATSFCYPRGKHSRRVARMVRAAGFLGARTVKLNILDAPADPYAWGVSTQAYSHSALVQFRHALVETNLSGLLAYATTFRFAKDWRGHLLTAAEHVAEYGGIVHLFLHGWEVAERDEWRNLEIAVRELADRQQLTCVTNGELFAKWQSLRSTTSDNEASLLANVSRVTKP
jgi:peptidoglycan-N-acetylglucosamine deacetylase